MLRQIGLTAGAAIALAATPASAISKHSWGTISDIGAAGLGAGALGLPLLRDDMPGFWQAGGSIGAATGASFILKQIVHEQRPDGSGNDSFPSTHASFAFASAATLYRRYGWQYGAPATLVAVLVGVARVESDKHHWYDVVAGAALGTASGLIITRPFNQNVELTPWADSGGGGVMASVRF